MGTAFQAFLLPQTVEKASLMMTFGPSVATTPPNIFICSCSADIRNWFCIVSVIKMILLSNLEGLWRLCVCPVRKANVDRDICCVWTSQNLLWWMWRKLVLLSRGFSSQPVYVQTIATGKFDAPEQKMSLCEVLLCRYARKYNKTTT